MNPLPWYFWLLSQDEFELVPVGGVAEMLRWGWGSSLGRGILEADLDLLVQFEVGRLCFSVGPMC